MRERVRGWRGNPGAANALGIAFFVTTMTFVISGSSVRPSVRRLAEDCRQLVIGQAPGDGESVCLQWCSGMGELEACAMLGCEGESATLCYRWRDGEMWRSCRQTIGLAFDVPHFGGVRRFWQCPTCKHGARKLYDAGTGRFACKRCLRLAHRSQRQKTWRRALARAAKIRSYLASNSSPADPFPERPKRMRRAVYDGLRAEAERLEALPAEAWLTDGRHVALGIRRSAMGASRRRWWPARNHRAG